MLGRNIVGSSGFGDLENKRVLEIFGGPDENFFVFASKFRLFIEGNFLGSTQHYYKISNSKKKNLSPQFKIFKKELHLPSPFAKTGDFFWPDFHRFRFFVNRGVRTRGLA